MLRRVLTAALPLWFVFAPLVVATETGKLKLTWSRVGDAVAIVWTETGFTPPEDIHRRGFGTTVMENMVGRALGSDD